MDLLLSSGMVQLSQISFIISVNVLVPKSSSASIISTTIPSGPAVLVRLVCETAAEISDFRFLGPSTLFLISGF